MTVGLLALTLIAFAFVAGIIRRGKTWKTLFNSTADFKVPVSVKANGRSNAGWDRTIEPLPDFDWTITPPTKLRPFKTVYNITMGMDSNHK